MMPLALSVNGVRLWPIVALEEREVKANKMDRRAKAASKCHDLIVPVPAKPPRSRGSTLSGLGTFVFLILSLHLRARTCTCIQYRYLLATPTRQL